MSSLRRRALLGATALLVVIGGSIGSAPSSSAHTCVGASVNGTTILPCHAPPNPGGHATCPNLGSNDTYLIVCVGG
jgi:hypothetical protein